MTVDLWNETSLLLKTAIIKVDRLSISPVDNPFDGILDTYIWSNFLAIQLLSFSHSFSTELIKINIGLLFLNNIEPNGWKKDFHQIDVINDHADVIFMSTELVHGKLLHFLSHRKKKIYEKNRRNLDCSGSKSSNANIIRAEDWRGTKTPEISVCYTRKSCRIVVSSATFE